MLAFDSRCPETATRETRIISIPLPDQAFPVGTYLLREFYCPDRACDCRRVIIRIIQVDPQGDPEKPEATLTYGWGPKRIAASGLATLSQSRNWTSTLPSIWSSFPTNPRGRRNGWSWLLTSFSPTLTMWPASANITAFSAPSGPNPSRDLPCDGFVPGSSAREGSGGSVLI